MIGKFGYGDLGVCVAVPVRLRRVERLVRVVEGGAKQEWGVAALGAQVLDSAEVRFFVVAEGVVPEVDAHGLTSVAAGVVRGAVAHDLFVVLSFRLLDTNPLFLDPRKVGRIDVGRQPTVEAVYLIGADEVHLARKHGVVARVAEIVGVRRHIRGQKRAVVPSTDLRGVASAGNAGAARSAQGERSIGRIKANAFGSETIQVRRLDDWMAVRTGQSGDELIGHYEEDIGTVGHGLSFR